MRAIAALILAPLAMVPSSASAEAPLRRPSPAFHESFGEAWDDLGRHLQGLAERWRDHLGRSASRRPLVSFMLRHRDALGLSSEQVRSLERIRSDFRREAIRREAELRVAELDLEQLLEAEPVDLGKVEGKIREIERLRGDLEIARVRAIEEGKALLTPEQRSKLDEMLGSPRARHPAAALRRTAR
jgi:Spy/CpxP family protein refolding chaperone